MILRHNRYWIVALLITVALAASGPKQLVTIEVGNEVVNQVHAPYIGLAIDTALIVGGEWWDGLSTRSNRAPLALDDPRLASAIINSGTDLIRIGGTEADKLYLGDDIPDGFASHLTQAQWQSLLSLAQATNTRLLFSANAGPSTRNADHAWQSDQFARLLSWTPADAPIDFELGNEFNAHWIFFGWQQQAHFDQYLLDFVKAQSLLGTRTQRLAGPANAFWPYLGEPGAWAFGSSKALFTLQPDIFTWHFYPTQSVRCGVATQNAFQRHLNSLDLFQQTKAMAEKIQSWNQGSEIWLGETGPAQCGGQAGVTDRAGSALWWLSHTGLMARTGNTRIIRQSLLGSDYALMDNHYRPRPDFYATLLFNHLMGGQVLNTNMTPNRTTRVFAHCHANSAEQAMLLVINMDDKPQALNIPQASRWLLINAKRFSDQFVTIHNQTIAADSLVGALPWQDVGASMTLPGTSYAFIEVNQMTVCQPQEDR